MSHTYDAVVVGGGHNGLVAAAYLARSGARTVVLEARDHVGGAATTESPWPDAPELRVTRLSYVMSLMPPTIARDLDLARHGYRVHPMGPYYQAFPEGGSLTIYEDDEARTYEQIARWSKKDAEAWPRWNAWLAGLADVMGPLLTRVPPNIGSRRPADLLDTARLAWSQRGLDVRTTADLTRLLTMSIADLLDDWFESPQIKGALAVNGVIGTWAGPYEPGTAYVMAHHSIGDVGDGHLGSWGFPEGGMGGVSNAIARAATGFGAEIRTGARVDRLIVRNGRVTGAVLTDGEEFHAPVVVTTLHPRIAFLEQIPRSELPESFVGDIERWKTRSGVVKINLALAELPNFTADPTDGQAEHHTGSVEMSPTMPFVERAFQDARDGRPAELPFSDGVIPTTLDRTLGPDGTHIMSLFTQWVPADWNLTPHTAELEAYADRVIDLYNEVAPNFKASITHRDIVGPHEMEQEYGLVGGNIFHGELSLEQLFHLRPAPGYADYRTPIAGLYNGGSATHAGGGVCGIPGWQSARAVIADGRRPAQRVFERAAPASLVAEPDPVVAEVVADGHRRSTGSIPAVPGAADNQRWPDVPGPAERPSSEAARCAAVAAMLDARSIALVGASARAGSFGARMVAEVARSTGARQLHLVNPRYGEIGGRRCHRSLAEVDGPLDLVLLAVGDDALVEQLALAAERGDRSAVIFGSAVGPDRRQHLRDIAVRAGMALCGAGCMGFVNVATGLRALGYVERDPIPAGPVALVTHSGSVFSALLRTRRALGFGLAVSSGQELVTTTADYVDHALADARTRVIALVLETVRDFTHLRSVLARAAAADVAVVVLPIGRTPVGAAMVAAHSGAVAGDDAMWEALTEATGMLRTRDLAELTDTVELLALARRPGPGTSRGSVPAASRGPRPPGSGIATVHDSGAERTLTADLAAELGVPFAEIGPPTRDRLARLLDVGLEAANPLDLWGTGADTRALFAGCLRAMAEDPAVTATVLAVDMVAEYDGDTAYADAVLDVAEMDVAGRGRAGLDVAGRGRAGPGGAGAAADEPGPPPLAVLSHLASAVDQATADRLRAAGVAVLEGTRSGLVALGHLHTMTGRDPGAAGPVAPAVDRARRDRWRARLERPGGLPGVDAFALLADYGIRAVPVRAATTEAGAVAAADDIGYPVVLKTDDPAVGHKSDVGGVVLGLGDAGAVGRAYRDVAGRLGPRVLVSATAPAGVEVSIGLVRDAQLGPLVVLAAGGVLVEVLADRVVACPPVSEPLAGALIDRLRIRPRLDGWRGAARADLSALKHATVGLSTLAGELGDLLDAIDVNPIIVGPVGALAVDVLVVPRPAGLG